MPIAAQVALIDSYVYNVELNQQCFQDGNRIWYIAKNIHGLSINYPLAAWYSDNLGEGWTQVKNNYVPTVNTSYGTLLSQAEGRVYVAYASNTFPPQFTDGTHPEKYTSPVYVTYFDYVHATWSPVDVINPVISNGG